MKKVKVRKWWFMLLSVCFGQVLQAQNDTLSINQLGSSFVVDFVRHPAFTGRQGGHVAGAGYTASWLGSASKPANMQAYYATSFGKKQFLGLGAYYNRQADKYVATNTLDLSLAFNINLSDNTRIRVGATVENFNWYQYKNWDALTSREHDVTSEYPTVFKNYADYSAGVWFEHRSFFLAMSYQHIKQHKNVFVSGTSDVALDFLKVPVAPGLQFTSGFDVRLNQLLKLQPVLDVNYTGFDNGFHYGQSSYMPALFANYKSKYLAGISSKNFNTLGIYAGALIGHVELGCSIGFPTNQMWQYSKVEHVGLVVKYYIL